MPSPVRPPSETTILLVDSRPPGQSRRSLTWERFRSSPEILLIPVALATSFAGGITSTTFIELLRQAVCRLWETSHGDPITLITVGPSPPEQCDEPEVARCFAIVLAILGVVSGVISIIGYGMFSRISSRYGRKPVFLIVFTVEITRSCMIAGSQHMPGWLAGWVFLVGMLFGLFSAPLGYLIDMYVVDKCDPEARTAALSKIAGWAGLGTCISFSLGGAVTTQTGNSAIVFYMATAVQVSIFIYVASFLPESFPKEKRDALSGMNAEPPATNFFAFLHIFEPLKMLVPARKPDGTHSWRLAWCAAHTFLYTVAESYASSAWLVLATSRQHFTPADTGLFLTVISCSSTIFLMVIAPLLIRFLGPYYRREVNRPLHEEEDVIDSEELESGTSDHLHVHLAVVSCVISALSFLGAAGATTNLALIVSGVCIGVTFMRGPATRSLIAGSVDPLKQGEALAAIGMVSNAGSVLSPIIMGSILTATIGTTPLLLFYVQLVVVSISCALLFLVRDADRFQGPHEE